MDENTNMKTANIRLPEAFGDRISFLRKLKGLTQAQLAEKLGISAQAVSKWESGLSCPDIMMLVSPGRYIWRQYGYAAGRRSACRK